MKKICLGLVLLAMVVASCHNGSGNMTDKCGPCPVLYNVAIFMAIKVRIVDKTTGADLFLSPNSPYKLSDLSVTSSLTGPDFHFPVDTTADTNNHWVWLLDTVSVTYTLQLARLSADHIKIVTGLTDQKCCAVAEVKSIMLNDSLVCTPCSVQQLVVIKK